MGSAAVARIAESSDGVAVIIPVYNGAAFLRRALDSVLTQTRAAAEIVVVDDGSTDGTREIVEAEYGGRVLLLTQRNGGPAKARNAGLRSSVAPLVAFLDADDWWEPTKLECQVTALRQHPEAVANYTGMRIMLDGGTHLRDEAPLPPDRLWPTIRLHNPGIVPSCLMVRRTALEAVGGFNERQRGSEDWHLLFGLRLLGQFCACVEPLTDYRLSAGGLSGDADHMYKDFLQMLDDTLLQGLEGWKRQVWRRRIVSYQAFHASMTARAAGDKARELSYMKMSLTAWPSPWWTPRRFKACAVMLLRRLH